MCCLIGRLRGTIADWGYGSRKSKKNSRSPLVQTSCSFRKESVVTSEREKHSKAWIQICALTLVHRLTRFDRRRVRTVRGWGYVIFIRSDIYLFTVTFEIVIYAVENSVWESFAYNKICFRILTNSSILDGDNGVNWPEERGGGGYRGFSKQILFNIDHL